MGSVAWIAGAAAPKREKGEIAGYEKAAPGTLPDAAAIAIAIAIAAMMQFNQSMQDAGVLLSAEGLHPPSLGARVSFAGSKPEVVEAPFPGVNEALGGYWIIEVNAKRDAIDWAVRCPASNNETIEIRQLQEAADFQQPQP